MTKTLDKLFDKAKANGVASKNGRKSSYYDGLGDLEEQWKIEFETTQDYIKTSLSHWGTEILEIEQDKHNGRAKVNHFYGESKSDRDAIMWLFNKFYFTNMGWSCSYRPSVFKFYVTADFGLGITETREV